jgi:hypothetical protein
MRLALSPRPVRARMKVRVRLQLEFSFAHSRFCLFSAIAEHLLLLKPRIIIAYANRIRIPIDVNVAAVRLLRIDHGRPITLAALLRTEMIAALPLRHRRLALQPAPRAINRRRHQYPPRQHDRRKMPKLHQLAYRGIPVGPQVSLLFHLLGQPGVRTPPTSTISNRREAPHLLILGAGVTAAQGSVKPTARFTYNQSP